jgi:hypothetical protein
MSLDLKIVISIGNSYGSVLIHFRSEFMLTSSYLSKLLIPLGGVWVGIKALNSTSPIMPFSSEGDSG